ncbi:thylakoid lumenal 19 kDa protein, chloroplastic [Phoenix dactylifera]|uniref:Thylakoid lumenal 19 kDa protein, chloroplastic n=1 Tax=Phoenix dactylifera TaxID=42345 RepID=A0A8B7CXD8_PHODC|nr:thylakoid lumenal 19 kDa protein, chloroplastic [Phoenix dactylifera]
MATLFAPSAVLSTATTAAAAATTTTTTSPAPPRPLIRPHFPHLKSLSTTLAATAAAASLLLSTPSPSLADSPTVHLYYGTAASAANYGGYGGNESKKDSAEYIYEVPDGWKERPISKVEKGTNGTDSEFYNPKKRAERVYLTFLPGFRALAPVDAVLSNLALSDVDLQDLIAGAASVRSAERRDDKGQLYYAYEIEGAGAHSLVSVTCARNKLYAHFVSAPNPEWNRDQDTLRRLHESFRTVVDPASPS